MISSAIGLFLPVVLALVGIIYLTIKENKRNKKTKNLAKSSKLITIIYCLN